jgi:hypothetical protein
MESYKSKQHFCSCIFIFIEFFSIQKHYFLVILSFESPTLFFLLLVLAQLDLHMDTGVLGGEGGGHSHCQKNFGDTK